MQYMQEVRLFIGSSGRDRKANEDGHFHLRDRKKNLQDQTSSLSHNRYGGHFGSG